MNFSRREISIVFVVNRSDDEEEEENEEQSREITKQNLKESIKERNNQFDCDIFESLSELLDENELVEKHDGTLIDKEELLEIHKRNVLVNKFIFKRATVDEMITLATKHFDDYDDYTIFVNFSIVPLNKMEILIQAIKKQPDNHILYYHVSNHLIALDKQDELIDVNGVEWNCLELSILSISLKETAQAYFNIISILDKTNQTKCMINFKSKTKRDLILSAIMVNSSYSNIYPLLIKEFSLTISNDVNNQINLIKMDDGSNVTILKCLELALIKCNVDKFNVYYSILCYLQIVYPNEIKSPSFSISLNNENTNIKTIISKTVDKKSPSNYKLFAYNLLVNLLDNDNDEISFDNGKTLKKSEMIQKIIQQQE